MECKPDRALVECLGFKDIHHAANKSKVTKQVLDFPHTVGLEDEDPGTTPSRDLKRFSTIEEKDDLVLLGWREKRIIILRPRLEEWILGLARQAGIDVRDGRYGLPDTPYDLKKAINNNLDRIVILYKDLEKHPSMIQLKRWLHGK